MKLIIILLLGFWAFVSIPCVNAQKIGFIEEFALADDREATLSQLVPGTEEYYYYRALVLQQRGDLEAVEHRGAVVESVGVLLCQH